MSTATSPLPRRRGMPRPRALGILAAAVMVVAFSYVWAGTHGAAPKTPAAVGGSATSDAAELAPGSIEQIDQSIKVWSANLAAEPRDFISATTLATLYYSRGRLSGDLADAQRALQFARTAITAAPTEAGGRATEAAVLYYLHDFAGARTAAAALYRDDPSQLGALATLADATLEMGDIAGARADFAKLSSLSSGAAVDIRLARLAYVTGAPADALALAVRARDEAARDVAAGGSADPGFYAYAVGEYARLAGDAATARSSYGAALAVRATDIGALVGLARIDAFEGHAADAIAGLGKAAAIAPQPETVALLGDLLAGSGDAAAATKQFETVRFIEKLGEIQSTVFDRVILRFELDHGGASPAILAKAQASLAARPDTTGHDTVAWALHRLGQDHEALTQITAAAADGAADARLIFHRGAIEVALGQTQAGTTDLRRALALGPALDPTERAEVDRLLGQ